MNWVDLARRVVPRPLRYRLQRYFSLSAMKLRHRTESNPLSGITSGDGTASSGDVRFGIVRNAAQYHTHFVQACIEMQLPFRVLDLARSDWLERVEAAECDVILVWPDAFLSIWGTMIKDRVAMLEQELGYPVVPSSAEIWMYEDKRRMAYWLQANRVPHPKTWIFYDRAEAEAFAVSCDLPVVLKTSFGAAATGVEIIRTRGRLRRLIRQAFRSGIVPGGSDHRDREWGSLLLQEYLPDVKEWRMVRIGDSFFGHPKGRVGEFHSGSGVAEWDVPESRHLDLLLEVTEKGRFRSMDVDIFETPDGRLLVNELQAVFGASVAIDQSRVNGQAGRFVRGGDGASWKFEPGDFARNACANERIRDALARGLSRRDSPAARREH
jgi:glutathione synthase/RimK-type ligase-like ATP-grasp enzyme